MFRVPRSWTGSVQMKSSMAFIRGNRCIDREKDTFKSREVKRLKECALALSFVEFRLAVSDEKSNMTKVNDGQTTDDGRTTDNCNVSALGVALLRNVIGRVNHITRKCSSLERVLISLHRYICHITPFSGKLRFEVYAMGSSQHPNDFSYNGHPVHYSCGQLRPLQANCMSRPSPPDHPYRFLGD